MFLIVDSGWRARISENPSMRGGRLVLALQAQTPRRPRLAAMIRAAVDDLTG
jgi:hypothetical protein